MLTEGQRMLLFAIHAIIENLEAQMSETQQAKLANAILMLRLPLDKEDAVDAVMDLDDAGFDTTSNLVLQIANNLI